MRAPTQYLMINNIPYSYDHTLLFYEIFCEVAIIEFSHNELLTCAHKDTSLLVLQLAFSNLIVQV